MKVRGSRGQSDMGWGDMGNEGNGDLGNEEMGIWGIREIWG